MPDHTDVPAADSPDRTTPEALLALLETERARLLAEVARVPEALRAHELVPGAWSVAQVVEHVSRVDGGVAKLIGMACAGTLRAPNADPSAIVRAPMPARMEALVRDRSNRLEAPERVRPSDGLSPEAAMAQLMAVREGLIDAFRNAPPAVLDEAAFPHPYFGPLTLRVWVELSAYHDARHAHQLSELADAAEAAPHA